MELETTTTYRDYVRETQRRRREALDKEAQAVGFKSWSELETAVKNHEYKLPELMDKRT